jgi:EmrB/QacA subfamily drug resistance transporter
MIIVDATIVNVAIPSIIEDLGIELVDAEWINTIYSLVFAAFLITLGRTGDLYGRKRLFHVGLVTFVIASMLAGQAPTGGLLIAARSLQGIGAAMILPSTLSIVNASFQGRERAIAFGIWGSVIGGMAALGPLLGGWLTTSFSWRWAFYINVPVGALALLGSWKWVSDSRDEHAERGFDPLGVATISVGLSSLVFGLIEGSRYGWFEATRPFSIGDWTWPLESVSVVPLAFALSLVLIPLFFWIESRRSAAGQPVLFNLALFRIKSFRYGNLTAAALSLGELGMIFILPLFLTAVLGYTAFQTGLLLLALAGGAFLGGPAAAAFAHRSGPRRVVTTGMLIEAVAIGSIALLINPDMTGGRLIPSLFVYGVGVGLATAQLTSVILVDVPPRQSGQASGMQSTFRQIGSALGIALVGTVLATSLGTLSADRLTGVPGLPSQAVVGIADAMRASAGQIINEVADQPNSAEVVAVLRGAFVDSARRAAMTAMIFVLVGFSISWLLPDTRPPGGKEVGHEPLPGEASAEPSGA